jgi:LPS O-antigen subunit length determinant protein (WzzB/FepE family)
MKPLVRLATRLYPSAWRKRYGNEFQALLEDVNPGWRELFDVFGGAIKMQLTTGATYMKLGAGFALAGLLIATIASFVVPKEYVSTAVLRVTNVDDLAKAETKVLSRTSLSQIIQDPALQLYPSERSEQPLEDVIEFMRRRAIHIAFMRTADQSGAISISFRYTDKKKAQAVVRVLIEKLSQAFAGAQTIQNLEILDPPNLPLFATSPKRWVMLTTGLMVGLLFGIIAAVFVKHTRRSLVFATLGLIGCSIGGAISFLIPNRYISKAVVRVVPYDHTFEQALNRLGRPGLHIQVIHLNGTPGAAAVELTFEDTDPGKAKSMVQSTISALMSGTIETAVESHGAIHAPSVEMLDNANLPVSPAYPNRMVISLLGLGVGFVAAAIALLIQRRRTTKLA